MGKYRILPSRIKPFGSGPVGRGGKGDVRLSKLVAPEDEEDPFAAEVEVNVAVKALRFTDSENKNRMLGVCSEYVYLIIRAPLSHHQSF